MTNKINGIDVSECSYYNKDNEPYCCEVWGNECEAQNCYFKQLKRLQEENEGLKSLNDFNVQKIEVLQEENKKLKNKNNDLIEEIASGNIDIAILQKENEKLKARLKTLDDEVLTIEITPDEFERYKKYRQALEEIRENLIKLDTNDEDDFCYEFSKLQSKIDEVLNDRD